jgi:hypothetical protein
MDLKLIEQKQLVERYLLGRLTPPEAKFFEQIIRKSPQLAERLGLVEALRRTMHLLDETGTEWRETAPKFWHRPWVPAVLGALVLAMLVVAVSIGIGKRGVEARYAQLKAEAARGLLVAPTRSAVMRVRVARPEEAPPTYPIGGRAAPTLAELRLDLSFVRPNLFKVVIKRADGTYWARLDNQVKDSNGELRLAFNSGAFAAGTYDVDVEAVNLRGEGLPAGHLRLAVDAG